jgi:hypothetical protein
MRQDLYASEHAYRQYHTTRLIEPYRRQGHTGREH